MSAGPNRKLRLFLAGSLLANVMGCSAITVTSIEASGTAAAQPDKPFPIFVGADALMKTWRRVQVWGRTEWRLVAIDGEIAIEPQLDGSSSALARWIEFDTQDCPVLEWTWRVDQLPARADLSSKKSEDVAASVFLAFGDPGTLSNPNPVPTLRYVWSTETDAVETVIDSPYFPGTLRSLVVRSGPDGLGGWVTEQRNLRIDYATAFGEPPTETVQVVAIFSDNDHSKDPVSALYSSAKALCTELPEESSIF